MEFFSLYQRRDLLTGFLVYGAGDAIASMLSESFSLIRLLGMCCTGAFIYGLEIPNYFRWVATRTHGAGPARGALLRTLLAMAYFNPLWVARHLSLIALFSGQADSLTLDIFRVALNSFLSAIPLTFFANMLIQNAVPLRLRFLASALFSCCMAIYYPLISQIFHSSV